MKKLNYNYIDEVTSLIFLIISGFIESAPITNDSTDSSTYMDSEWNNVMLPPDLVKIQKGG